MEHLNFKTIVLSVLAVLGLAVSCSKENKPEKKTETKPELSLSETQLTLVKLPKVTILGVMLLLRAIP